MGVAPEQSALTIHGTQVAVVVSQIIAPASVHCALLVQPAAQVPRRQIGAAAAVQLALMTHATQVCVVVLQSGVAVMPQSVLDRHCTHCLVVGSQMGLAVAQSIAVWQPMHAPVAVSQIGVAPAHCAPPSPPQAA
jgi:hypothetical protein